MKKLVSFAILISLFACNGKSSDAVDLPENQLFAEIDAEQFVQKMSESNIVVLDVRSPEEYAEGALAEAELYDYDSGEFSSIKSMLDPSKVYLIYCRTGRRSELASRELAELGIRSFYTNDDWQTIKALR